MTNDWQQQMQQMVEQGKQSAAGMVTGGEMIIDADPERGFFRVKLRNVQPPQMAAHLASAFCAVLANGGAMFNLQIKQHIREAQEPRDD